MTDETAKLRQALLIKLERIVGGNCSNGYIQNWGPNGVRYEDGRTFRYPLRVVKKDNSIEKYVIPSQLEPGVFGTGYYAFGANRLEIVRSLDEIVSYLEKEYGLEIAKDKPE